MKEFPLSEIEPRIIAKAETKRWSSKQNTLNHSLLEIKDEDKSNLKAMMDFYEGNIRFRAEYLGNPR